MRTFAILTLLLLSSCVFGQTVRIDTLFLPKPRPEAEILKFPLIRTGNPKIDSSINRDLKNRFTNNEFADLPTDSTLIKWAEERITHLGFEITYLKDGLISLNITSEGCEAYCSSWTEYFTYSTQSGKYIPVDEILDITGKFKSIVIADRDGQYATQKRQLGKSFTEKKSELDKTTYNLVLEAYENCRKSFEFKSFALHSDHLEIIEKCELPHVIQNLTPIIELKYNYKDVAPFLKTKQLATP